MPHNTSRSGAEATETQEDVVPDHVPVAPQVTFAMTPEWVLDADVSDGAVRLYGFLARYANSRTGLAYPKRRTLAERMRKSMRTISAYLRELESIGAIVCTPKYRADTREQDGNYYTIMSTPPAGTGLQSPSSPPCSELQAPLAEDCKARTRANELKPVNENPPTPQADETAQGELAIVAESAPPAGGGVTKRKREQYPPEFAGFWEVYPKKADKRAALKAWRAAKKRVLVSDDELIAAAKRYRDDPNRSDQFTKNAATWLNADAWENGPLPARNGNNRAQERLNNNLGVVQYFAEQEQAGNYWGELDR